MPRLLRKKDSGWLIEDDTTLFQPLAQWDGRSPVLISPDTELDENLLNATAIAIEFPAFTDGRALSLAVLLRTRYNYSGELRAVSATHEDIVHYLVRCGFDAIEVASGRDPQRYLDLTDPYTSHYQGSVADPTPSFGRVHRGANA